MEYVNFYPNTFFQIDKQDNPAFDKNTKECLMIVRDCSAVENSEKYMVHHVRSRLKVGIFGYAKPVAIFWKEYIAIQFCRSFDPENLL